MLFTSALPISEHLKIFFIVIFLALVSASGCQQREIDILVIKFNPALEPAVNGKTVSFLADKSHPDLTVINQLLSQDHILAIRSHIQETEPLSDDLKAFFALVIGAMEPGQKQQLVSDLSQLSSIVDVYEAPQGEDAGMSLPTD